MPSRSSDDLEKDSGCYAEHLPLPQVPLSAARRFDSCRRCPHAPHKRSLTRRPIDGRVEPLDANDSPLILIRETHQIQTTSRINRQVLGEGTWVTYRDNFQSLSNEVEMKRILQTQILHFKASVFPHRTLAGKTCAT